MEKLFDIYVEITGITEVRGSTRDVKMIFFTGRAEGKYFRGLVEGTGTDTQFISKDNEVYLSARYMLTGTDADGKNCRVFIENSGSFEKGFVGFFSYQSK